jgi:hypothetical protein
MLEKSATIPGKSHLLKNLNKVFFYFADFIFVALPVVAS